MLRIRQRYAGTYTFTANATDANGVAVAVTSPLAAIYSYGEEVWTGTPDETLTVTVPVADLPLGVYEVRFTGTAEEKSQEWRIPIEIVGGHYFSLAELRAYGQGELASELTYPDDLLREIRAAVTDDFEELANRSFYPRGAKAHTYGGEQVAFMPRRDVLDVVSVSHDGTDLDITGVATDPIVGAIRHPSRWPEGLLTIRYVHGQASPHPSVKRAVLLLAHIYAVPSAIDPRQTAVINTDIGGYRISVAGKDGTTGIPDVDAAAARYGDNMPAVG